MNDAHGLAELHVRNLPDALSDFTQLGMKIVRRFYRQSIARGFGAAICAEDEDGLAAYVFVTRDVGALFSGSLLNDTGDAVRFLLEVRLKGLIAAFWTKITSRTLNVQSAPELVYLVVDSRSRGRRLASTLMEQADSWFKERGFRFYQLHVQANNEAALRTYFRSGHKIAHEFVKDGIVHYRLQKELD